MNSFFSKGVIQERRREKDFPRQATYKGVHDHLISPVRNFKRDSARGEKRDQKKQRLERTRERHQKHQLFRKHKGTKFISLNNHSEC